MGESKYNASGTEREFLHDLSNPLAIAYGNMRIISAKLESDINSMDIETILTKINKSLNAFEKANQLLEQRRFFIKNSGAKQED